MSDDGEREFQKGDKVQIKNDFDGVIGNLYGGVKYDEQHEELKGKPLEISDITAGIGNMKIYIVREAGEDIDYFVSPEMIEGIGEGRIIDAEEVIPGESTTNDTPAQVATEKRKVAYPPDISEEQKMSNIIKGFKEKNWDKFKDPEDFWAMLYEYVDMKDLLR